MQSPFTPEQEKELISDVGAFTHDPLGYVMYAFPWGEGELAKHKGPREWQRDYLSDLGARLKAGTITMAEAIAEIEALPDALFEEPVDPSGATVIRKAISSGHGIGKSALVSWIIKWGLDTFEDTRIIVTANTEGQLKTKTWAELAKWHRLAITSHWFTFTATALYSADKNHEKTWRCDMIAWSETNTEAFAGLHNQGKRVIIIFDEASAISDKIWEVTEGACTDADTEIIWVVFGNPTRNTGRFRECFGRRRHRWVHLQIDSRNVEDTNKAQFKEWIDDYGEDSDFVRVRVRGMFPRASSLQLIDSDTVAAAMKRPAHYNIGDPLIMALDIARGGDDFAVFRFRRGLDARSIPPVRIPGSELRDSMRLVGLAVQLVEKHKPDAFFFDETGVGGPVGDRIGQLGYTVLGVQFGGSSPDPKCLNMRSYMWVRMRDWLKFGAIDDDTTLETDLTSVEYDHNAKDQLRLEAKEHMKKRGLASPDDGDALAMTFAYPVALQAGPGSTPGSQRGRVAFDGNPLEQ